MSAAIEFRGVDILFARQTGRAARKAVADALGLLDTGGTRAQISEKFGVVVGVAGASLSVESGHISVLMGLSGSGKSTLLRAANGLNRVTRGSVLIRDGDASIDVASCDTLQMRRVRRGRVAMVFQQFGLLPWRTVRENVGLGLELRGERADASRKIVDEKLELVGLSSWAERYVRELSGGMQQRVGLARAFATDAEILLMDEPFSALDPLIRSKLQDELLELQARVKKTILFVSHDLDEALRLGDRITIMQSGRIVQTGTAEDIIMAPADEYVAEFVHHMNPLDVLTGGMIMCERAQMPSDAGGMWLDPGRRYQLRLDAFDEPVTLTRDGQSLAVCRVADDAVVAAEERALAIAPATLSLLEIIKLRQTTGHPVLLTADGRIVGVCGEAEIIRALAGKRGSGGSANRAAAPY